MAAFTFDLDDSSGEGLGSGLDSGALDLTGSSALDDGFDDTGIGSSIELGGSDTDLSVSEPFGSLADLQLSGVTEAIAGESDSGSSSTNGSGSASSSHPLDSSDNDLLSSAFSGINKYGSAIGQLLGFAGSAPTQATVASQPANVNPNRAATTGLSSGNALLIIFVITGIGLAVALGGDH